eukprot:scaffold236557_cov28-Tisochrysis_lutea.AAC.1
MACARAHRGCGGMRGGSGRRTLHRSNYNNSFPADRHLDVDVGMQNGVMLISVGRDEVVVARDQA